jgi:hypothetical protein
MVEQTPGGRGEDVHAAAEVVHLLAVTDAAVDDRHPQVGELGVFLKRLLDLQRQFARGLEDEAAQLAVPAQALDDRQRKGRRLAGAGLGRADDIATLQHHRNRLRLDRRRGNVAHFLHGESQRITKPELVKIPCPSSAYPPAPPA